MKNLQILFLVFCANVLLAQSSLNPPNSNFATASIRPCPFDTTQSLLQADHWVIYQTLNDKWNGIVDSSKCIGVTLLDTVGIGQLVIELDQVDIAKPVFVRSLMDDSTKVLLKSNWIYSAQSGMTASDDAFGNFSPNCANGFCSGVFWGIEVPDSAGTGTDLRIYSDGIQSGSNLTMFTCLPTERFEENYLKEVIFKFKLLGTSASNFWFRPNFTVFYEGFEETLGYIDRDTFVYDSQYNASDSSYNLSILNLVIESSNFWGGDLLVTYHDSTYPSVDHISYIELTPENNDTFPQNINIFMDFFGSVIFQPFTAFRGSFIEGSDSIRHPVNLFLDGGDFCLEGGFVELIFNDENNFIYIDGQVNFGGASSCFRFQEGSSLIVKDDAYFQYGDRGEGMLALATGGSIELGKNSTLFIDNTVMLYELPKLYGVEENQQIYMELNEGSTLAFGEHARLFNKYSIDKNMKLNIFMNGGTLDISNLKDEYKSVLNLIYPTPTPNFNDNLNVFPNPTNGELNLSLVLEKEERVEISAFDLTGKDVFSQSEMGMKGVNKISTLLNNFTPGIYFFKVKTSLGEAVEKVIVF